MAHVKNPNENEKSLIANEKSTKYFQTYGIIQKQYREKSFQKYVPISKNRKVSNKCSNVLLGDLENMMKPNLKTA